VAEDADSMGYNIAGLASVDRAEVSFTQNNYIENISQQWAALALPVRQIGTFGVGINYLGINGISGYDAYGNSTGGVPSYDLALDLGYGRSILDLDDEGIGRLDGGAALKYVEETLDTTKGSTFATDFGLIAKPTALPWFKLGLAVENLGGTMKFIREAEEIPLKVKIGGSAQGSLYNLKGLASIEMVNDYHGSNYVALGLEGTVMGALSARLGYETHRDVGQGLDFGAGFQLDRLCKSFPALRIDYAYAGYGSFGNTHRFGFTFAFGPKGGWGAKANKLRESGDTAMEIKKS